MEFDIFPEFLSNLDFLGDPDFLEFEIFAWIFLIKYGFFCGSGFFRIWDFSLNISYEFALFFLILISWSMIFFSEYVVSIEFGIFCGSGFSGIRYFPWFFFYQIWIFCRSGSGYDIFLWIFFIEFGIITDPDFLEFDIFPWIFHRIWIFLEFEYLDFWLMFRHDFNGRLLKSIRRMFSVARYKFKATQVGRILKFDQDVIPRLGYQTPIKSFASVRSTQTVLFVVLDFGLKRRWRVSVRGEKTDFAKLFVFQLLYFALQAWMGANVLE